MKDDLTLIGPVWTPTLQNVGDFFYFFTLFDQPSLMKWLGQLLPPKLGYAKLPTSSLWYYTKISIGYRASKTYLSESSLVSNGHAVLHKARADVLKYLHWLPIEDRTKFQLTCQADPQYSAAPLSLLISTDKNMSNTCTMCDIKLTEQDNKAQVHLSIELC